VSMLYVLVNENNSSYYLQPLMNRYRSIRFAQVPERVSSTGFVALRIGNSRVESLMCTGHR